MKLEVPNKEITVEEIARLTNARILGDKKGIIRGLCPLVDVRPDALSFTKDISLTSLEKLLSGPPFGALYVKEQIKDEVKESPFPLLFVRDPLAAMVKAVEIFYEDFAIPRTISKLADVDPSAVIGKNVAIGSFSWIGARAQIHDEVTIMSHVAIYPGAIIRKGAFIHSGAVIRETCVLCEGAIVQNGAIVGADGFGYVPVPGVGLQAVPQVGNVILEKGVDVGANACIDRATFGVTRVGTGSKIDNLVQVGHNVQIGQHSVLCGQVAIGGSTVVGNQVTIGGNTGIADHLKIADGVRVGGHSGVATDLAIKGDYMGTPAIPVGEWRRASVSLRQLSKLLKRSKIEDK